MGNGFAFRYGPEVEGRFKGEVTLILPSVTMHKPAVVEAALRRNNATVRPTHLWVETQADEQFDWMLVEELLKNGFNVTVQVREPSDTPPVDLLMTYGETFSVVWMVPERFRNILTSAEFIKYAVAPGDGFEAELKPRNFNPDDYAKDLVWPA